MNLPDVARDILDLALLNCTRAVLQTSEFLPIVEGALLIMRGDEPIGIRVYFEPPVKSAYWSQSGAVVLDVYGDNRKAQAPLDCDYYVFTVKDGVLDIDSAAKFSNPREA